MNSPLFRWIAGFILIAGGSHIAAADGPSSPSLSLFKRPVRLKADGKIIDTDPAWGHSSPCVEDLDGDGRDDLVVGDFSGTFRYYRNVGTAKAPAYKVEGRIQAGGADAKVRIYCCIGAQPRFCDLNGDGLRDMIANSYDPGHCYLFRRLADNRFAGREELLDKSGVPVRSAPVQKQDYQSFGSIYEPVDWDDDGDFDLLIGCFAGELKLRMNEGTTKRPEFAVDNIPIAAAGEPLKVTAHLCPVVADWDGDGLWDIIAGSDDGSVTWFRNVGSKTSPAFAAGQTLVEKHDGSGYNLAFWSDADVIPGIRSQIEVTDYNGDGKLDLLVGDFYTAYDFKKNLSEEQKHDVRKLIAEGESLGKELRKKFKALQEEFEKRYPGDKIFSDEADREWRKAYQSLRASPEAKHMKENEKRFVEKMRPFLADFRAPGDRRSDLAKPHGHVWLFIRR